MKPLDTYEQQLQRSLDWVIYRNAKRDKLSSRDEDVLQIFSGDENAARHGLKVFHERHEKGDLGDSEYWHI